MIYKKIFLKDYYPNAISGYSSLTAYCISNHHEYPFNVKRKTILVIPGGGYEFVSNREAEPIAIKFMSENFNVFVLDYSVGQFVFPYPLIEAYAAICYIREHHEEYNVDLNYVGVLGFSAGGHLAASISCYYLDEYYAKLLSTDIRNLKIDFTILGYPVTTTDEKLSHKSTRELISQNDEKLLDYFDIVKHVTSSFPPTFIWTTKEDKTVPFENSVLLKQALDRNDVINELALYKTGNHGGSTCDELTVDENEARLLKDASEWIKKASAFVKSL